MRNERGWLVEVESCGFVAYCSGNIRHYGDPCASQRARPVAHAYSVHQLDTNRLAYSRLNRRANWFACSRSFGQFVGAQPID